jgi:hypothetical protein
VSSLNSETRPGNVRYLGQFGEHLFTRSFTARDPQETSNRTLLDYLVSHVGTAGVIVTSSSVALLRLMIWENLVGC